jgi:hypothetical protein
VECAPLVISRGGGILATVRAKESQPAGDDTPAAVAGTWSADPEAIAAAGAIPGLGWVRGRSASGDFSGTVSSWAELDGSLAVSGITPGTSLSASGHVEVGMDGTVSFQIPVKVSSGSIASDVTAEGTWTGDPAGPGLEAKLTGTTVFLEHLELLAGAIARAEGGSPSTESTTGTDRVPFWGSWSGRVGIDFDKLSALNREFDDATGTFDWDQGAIRFKNGRAVYSHHNLAKLEASISFDPTAEQPYGLSAAADASDIDASRLIPGRQSGGDPMLEGHFSVAATSTGRGGNLRDLAEGAKDVFRLKSSGGIIRILKTSVAEAIPEAPAKVTDTLGKVGSSLGSFFGAEPKSADLGSNPISKNAEAVLDFTYAVAEIGFDEMTVTATVGTDKAIGLTDLSITAPDERLTGSGRISYVEGLPLDERPLSLDLAIGTRGDTGDLLAKAGLLSDDKDDLGYTALVQPVHFGGSLAHIDASRWHDLLVKAATRKPDAATQSQ